MLYRDPDLAIPWAVARDDLEVVARKWAVARHDLKIVEHLIAIRSC